MQEDFDPAVYSTFDDDPAAILAQAELMEKEEESPIFVSKDSLQKGIALATSVYLDAEQNPVEVEISYCGRTVAWESVTVHTTMDEIKHSLSKQLSSWMDALGFTKNVFDLSQSAIDPSMCILKLVE